ncbi:unnamed protein product [Protopolystoma xenopodis]|uniref:Uncharacterized protein n=1 Tax=Protopolystoma xenopodis TaxID=117903 RepID=A0A448WHD9_9PLAT|nr:unnamed protein product [Protopolystoma xenopodis]
MTWLSGQVITTQETPSLGHPRAECLRTTDKVILEWFIYWRDLMRPEDVATGRKVMLGARGQGVGVPVVGVPLPHTFEVWRRFIGAGNLDGPPLCLIISDEVKRYIGDELKYEQIGGILGRATTVLFIRLGRLGQSVPRIGKSQLTGMVKLGRSQCQL